ncbi:hypothetical protein BXZ70DRAFT_911456 [Cristinia sonorae]|uniref:Uncharacterized protein n=1 Tax=Cristinia sonorae TaxID=1940300 RepID=A0A8K0XK76_9AGAR|nr:hypothetical protein BXZ70DRAFT_911456 [Cristinia sonorae]
MLIWCCRLTEVRINIVTEEFQHKSTVFLPPHNTKADNIEGTPSPYAGQVLGGELHSDVNPKVFKFLDKKFSYICTPKDNLSHGCNPMPAELVIDHCTMNEKLLQNFVALPAIQATATHLATAFDLYFSRLVHFYNVVIKQMWAEHILMNTFFKNLLELLSATLTNLPFAAQSLNLAQQVYATKHVDKINPLFCICTILLFGPIHHGAYQWWLERSRRTWFWLEVYSGGSSRNIRQRVLGTQYSSARQRRLVQFAGSKLGNSSRKNEIEENEKMIKSMAFLDDIGTENHY